jgi:hypothetical protein
VLLARTSDSDCHSFGFRNFSAVRRILAMPRQISRFWTKTSVLSIASDLSIVIVAVFQSDRLALGPVVLLFRDDRRVIS